MSETRNIVILGASAGGLSAGHYIAKHTLPQLAKLEGVKYELHIVDPSTHFWWHVSAPRAIVSLKDMPNEKTFVPIKDGFKQYTSLQDSIHFHQASATAVDTSTRNVTIQAAGQGTTETLPYYALIIATGISSPTPLTTLHGDHTISLRALEEANSKLASSKEIVIGGGGPIGVETAGEIATAEHLKGKTHITLVSGGDKLLPVLRKSIADKAQKQLEKLGVTVIYNTKVTGTTETAEGKTEVTLSNGKTLTADFYFPASGVKPNTSFLPAELKQENGYVKTNSTTLRVDGAGPRVYALGDVAAVDRGGILKLVGTVPIWGANFNHDILGEAKVATIAEKSYKRKDEETQVVPVGAKTGVGAFKGIGFPGFMIAAVKGKTYFVQNIGDFTEGKKWTKA